jgi:citrate lyase subunit beta/citryl-CoA lyase
MATIDASSEEPIRSLLFCPATEPRKVAKLSGSGADAVALDLEDAVASGEKASARAGVRAALATLHDPLRCVRVNPLDSRNGEDDVRSAVCLDLDAIIAPKIETRQDLRHLDRLIEAAEIAGGIAVGRIEVIALIETAAGVCAAQEIASAGGRLLKVALGSADLGNDLGLSTMNSDVAPALGYGRSKLVYDARAAGLESPLDGPFLEIRDQEGLATECRLSRSLGYGGRVCVHPDQVATVNRAFAPDPADVEFA